LRLLYVARESNIRLDERVNERMRLARICTTPAPEFPRALLKLHAVTYRLPDHLEARKELEAAIELARRPSRKGRCRPGIAFFDHGDEGIW
jgi:hypothetical protein